MQIILDSDTARFFDDKFHRGEAKQSFHLRGLGERIFGGRKATSRNGQRVLICQESRGRNCGHEAAPIFLIEESLRLPKVPCAEMVLGVLSAQKFDLRPNPILSPQTHLPIFETGVWRYHADEVSGWGCRVNSLGHAHLRDLAHTSAEQEKEWFYYPVVLGWAFGKPVTPTSSYHMLLDHDEYDFHGHMDAALNASTCDLKGAIAFYRQSEEELCQGILGCDLATRRRAEEKISHHLAGQTRPGGALEGVCSWTWLMWIDSPLFVRSTNGVEESIPAPDAFLKVRAEVLARLDCRLAPSDLEWKLDQSRGHCPIELLRSKTWAAKFTCASP